MAGPFGVFDEEAHLFGRGRAAHGEGVGDLLEGAVGTVRNELIGSVEFGSDISLHLFKWDIVEGREARYLGNEAERGPGDEILQGSRPQFGSAARGGFIGFEMEFAHAAFDVHVLEQLRHGADSGFAEGGVTGKAGAGLFVDLAALFHVDAVFGFVGHTCAPFDLARSAGERGYSVPEKRPKEKLLLALSPYSTFVQTFQAFAERGFWFL